MKTTFWQFWLITFINEFHFSITMMRRYLFDTVVGLVTVYILFLVIFFGLKILSGPNLEANTLDAIIVGYIMWMFALNAYTSTSSFIIEEAKQGTLEQLFMAPAGFHWLLLARLMLGFLNAIVFNGALLFLTMLTTGRWLDIPVSSSLLVIALAIPSVYGLGYIIAGFALVFKRVAALSNIMQFILIAFVSLPSWPANAFSLLPFTTAANVVNQLIVQGETVPAEAFVIIALDSVFYFLAGLMIFKGFARKAMALNVLGHY